MVSSYIPKLRSGKLSLFAIHHCSNHAIVPQFRTRKNNEGCTNTRLFHAKQQPLKIHNKSYRISSSLSTTTTEIDTETIDFRGESVHNTIQKSTNILLQEHYEPSEAKLLICHILSQALNLSYENNDFMKLYNLNNQELANRILTNQESNQFKNMLRRLKSHEPIQYVLGIWDFYNFSIKCKEPILIPRPETEELIDYVLKDIKQGSISILDVGCGTGCISIALHQELNKLYRKVDVVAIDISEQAIQLTQENIKSIVPSNNITVIQSSIQDFVPNKKFDYIVSNPPYIPKKDMITLSNNVIKYEDYNALWGGDEDGLLIIKQIIYKAFEFCEQELVVWMEVDPTHPNLLKRWLEEDETIVGFRNEGFFIDLVNVLLDLSGNERFVKLSCSKKKGY